MQRLIGSLVIIVYAIEQILIRDLAVAGDVEASPEAQIRTLSRREHVRLKLCKLKVVTAV